MLSVDLNALDEEVYPVCNCTRHTSDKYNASSISKPDHLLRGSLCSHHHTSNVDLEHAVGILCSIIQGWSFLLNAGSCNQSIKSSFLVADLFDDLVERSYFANINLSVLKRGSRLFRLFGNDVKVW